MNEKLNNYYNKFNEDKRLETRHGIIEFQTTIKNIEEVLSNFKNPKILDVGAGTGKYSLYLNNLGYDITAVELVKHNLKVIESKNKNIKTVPSNIKNSNNIIKLNPRLKDIPHNIERIHELNHLYYNDNKRFIVEDIKLDILNHIKLPFRYKNDEFRMTKYFKDFGKLTRISFTPSNVTLK